VTPHTTRHLDEVYLKIDGRMSYPWRGVDTEGEALSVLVTCGRAVGVMIMSSKTHRISPAGSSVDPGTSKQSLRQTYSCQLSDNKSIAESSRGFSKDCQVRAPPETLNAA
jgi:transposase-like protein